jgi:hypothetical protein
MGVLISLEAATKGAQNAIDHGGVCNHHGEWADLPTPSAHHYRGTTDGKKPQTPPTVLPYITAEKLAVEDKTETLF